MRTNLHAASPCLTRPPSDSSKSYLRHTTVPACFKDDIASQLKAKKFDPPPRLPQQNPEPMVTNNIAMVDNVGNR